MARMKTLYQAANALEAHMLADLLKQEGLQAQVLGEHLQGAVGELPAGGFVRLLIPDEQHSAARAVIERWEATQVSDPTPARAAPVGNGRGVWIFLAGVVVGLVLGLGLMA
jgi:hypothetical protein